MNYTKILTLFVSSLLLIQCRGGSSGSPQEGNTPAPAQLVAQSQSTISTALNSVVETLSTGIQQMTSTGSASNTVASETPVSPDTSLNPISSSIATISLTNTNTVVATNSTTSTSTVVATNSTTSTSTGTVIDSTATPGTASNPYPIRTVADLLTVPNYTSSSTYFIQMQDIDLTGVAWTAIPLYGNYNGNGFSIQNLKISYSYGIYTPDVALFSTVNAGAVVSNLNVTNVNLTGTMNIGGLVSQLLSGGTVDHCTSSGSITVVAASTGNLMNAGGLVAFVSGGTVSNSSSSVSIVYSPSTYNGNIFNLGGLVGRLISGATSAVVTNSFSTGSITTSPGSSYHNALYSGGLIAFAQSPSGSIPFAIQNSYSTSNQSHSIQNTKTTKFGHGGLIGYISSNGQSDVVDGCFANTMITVSPMTYPSNIGSLVGIESSSTGSVTISNSYTMGTISYNGNIVGSSNVGGFVGSGEGHLRVSTSYVAVASISASAAMNLQGFMAGTGGTVTNSYFYQNPNVPPSTVSGVTTYLNSWQMLSPTNFPGFTFGKTSPNNWVMPTANLMSPSLLSPVLFWQCGNNGVKC